MINTPEGKQFVRDLTMEYIRQNKLLYNPNEETITNIIDRIVKIENDISDSVEKRRKDFKSF